MLRAPMPPRILIVDPEAEYEEIGADVEQAVLRSRRYILGPETRGFEEELAALVGVAHAVGVGSGPERVCAVIRASIGA